MLYPTRYMLGGVVVSSDGDVGVGCARTRTCVLARLASSSEVVASPSS